MPGNRLGKLRRWPLAAAVGIAVSLVVLTGCGDNQGETQRQPPAAAAPQADSKNVDVANRGSRFAHLRLSTCRTRIGGDVRVHRLSCKKAQDLEGVLADYRLFGSRKGKPDVYRSGARRGAGWRCSARLSKAAIIQHLCWRRGQILMFKFAG
jgi:hypothetical protein